MPEIPRATTAKITETDKTGAPVMRPAPIWVPIRFRGVTTAAKLASALTALATAFEFMDSPNYFTPASIAAATK